MGENSGWEAGNTEEIRQVRGARRPRLFLFSATSSFWYKPQRRRRLRPPANGTGKEMETSHPAPEADGPPVLGALRRPVASLPVPVDFVSLRLVLQPSGATVEVTQPDVLIGRHSLADVRLPLPDVSRRHCRLMFSQGYWQIIDLNSLNGVFLNGEPIHQATVRSGDLIRIGGFTFVAELSEAFVDATETAAPAGLIRVLFDGNRLPPVGLPPQRRAS